jgi:hypothetical protein
MKQIRKKKFELTIQKGERNLYIQDRGQLIEVVPSSIKAIERGYAESSLRTRRTRKADIEGKDYYKITDKIFLYPKKVKKYGYTETFSKC